MCPGVGCGGISTTLIDFQHVKLLLHQVRVDFLTLVLKDGSWMKAWLGGADA